MSDEPFQPDWRLSPHEALATHVRLALSRRGISWGGKLDSDKEWSRMCLEILQGLANDRISPCKVVEIRRSWDRRATHRCQGCCSTNLEYFGPDHPTECRDCLGKTFQKLST